MNNVSLMASFSTLFPGLIAADSISPVEAEVNSTVTLSYTYSKQATAGDYFFWYRQYPGKPPEFLISHLGTQNDTNNRLSVKVSDDKTKMHLKTTRVSVSDSAVYYCAVRPTVTGNTKTLQKPLEQRQHNTPQHPLEGVTHC
uniref:Ig-like domain-containing protein n=1 Tax=Sparus aurata TaxID=8175 RepID=A0A671U343_SPAAU